jgi:mono/diheme cytochrome c family protein
MIVVLQTAGAQQAGPAGESVYMHLGCWNCHGMDGRAGKYVLPIANTRLPLEKFVDYVRTPTGTMPPFKPSEGSDSDLAAVYQWLESSSRAEVNGPEKKEVELAAETPQSSSAKSLPRLDKEQFEGEALYLRNCAYCHSVHKTISQSDLKPDDPLNAKSAEPGIFIGVDLKSLMHQSQPADQVLQVMIQKGVPLKMPGFQYELEPAEIDSIIAYLHTL